MRCSCIAGHLSTIPELVNAMFLVPVQTAPAERGFSVQRFNASTLQRFSVQRIAKTMQLDRPPENHGTSFIVVQLLTQGEYWYSGGVFH